MREQGGVETKGGGSRGSWSRGSCFVVVVVWGSEVSGTPPAI